MAASQSLTSNHLQLRMPFIGTPSEASCSECQQGQDRHAGRTTMILIQAKGIDTCLGKHNRLLPQRSGLHLTSPRIMEMQAVEFNVDRPHGPRISDQETSRPSPHPEWLALERLRLRGSADCNVPIAATGRGSLGRKQ